MSVSSAYLAYVIDQLAPLAGVTSRRMFGGVGLYADQLFFALIADDALYFKVDDTNRGDYTRRNCPPFVPYPDDPNAVSFSYFQVPADVLEDCDELAVWARKAVRVAAASAAAKAQRTAARKKRPAKARARTRKRAR